MNKVTLDREDKSDEGVFGIMRDEAGNKIAVTCERPDNGNQEMGCIPAGTYLVMPFASPHEGADFLVHDVPGRSMIEIHSGNTIKDTKGCIIVGHAFGKIEGMKAVINSKRTLAALLAHYPTGFMLTITEE